MSNDLFSKKNLVGGGTYAKFVNVGDKVQGVYVDRTVMANTMKNCDNAVYHLRQDDGSIVYVQGKVPVSTKPEKVLPELENIAQGFVVGVQFTETRPTKKGNDLKVLKVYKGEYKPEVLEEYRGVPTITKLPEDSDLSDIAQML